MKFLIAGLGSIGRRHLQNLEALGERDITLYRTGKSTLRDLDNDYPVYDDIHTAIKEQPDAIVISNPTALHIPVAIIAARSDIDIFIEKPLSHAFDNLQAFEVTLQNSASKVFVAYQFRFNAGLKKIKLILDQKELGNPVSFQSIWGEYLPDWHPWEDYRNSYAARKDMGGGVVLTLSHPIDYLRWFFGDVAELKAEVGKRSDLDLDCEDYAEADMTFQSGVKGKLHLDYGSKPKVHHLSIQCEQGKIEWDYSTSIVEINSLDGAVRSIHPPADYARNQMYIDEMAHFITLCQDDIEPICSYQDGKKALDIGLGILQSGRYQDRVIFEE